MPSDSRLPHSLIGEFFSLLCSVMDLPVGNPETKGVVKSHITEQSCLGVLLISVGHL